MEIHNQFTDIDVTLCYKSKVQSRFLPKQPKSYYEFKFYELYTLRDLPDEAVNGWMRPVEALCLFSLMKCIALHC